MEDCQFRDCPKYTKTCEEYCGAETLEEMKKVNCPYLICAHAKFTPPKMEKNENEIDILRGK